MTIGDGVVRSIDGRVSRRDGGLHRDPGHADVAGWRLGPTGRRAETIFGLDDRPSGTITLNRFHVICPATLTLLIAVLAVQPSILLIFDNQI